MPTRFQNLRRLAILGCLPFFGSQARAQLASNSPFLPPQNSGPAAPTVGAPLEYGGFLEDRDGRLFRVISPSQKKGAWVRLNEREPSLDFTLKQHDADQNTVTLEQQGRTMTLELRKPRVVSSGSAVQAMQPPPMPMQPGNAMPAAVTQAVVLNPTPADEQNRLNAVATEVQRRRALREQASQNVNSPAMPPAVPPPPKNMQAQPR